MKIRYAKESDLKNGLLECFQALYGEFNFTKRLWIKRLKERNKMLGVKVFVVERDGMIIGSATLIPEVKLTRNLLAAHLEDVCVMKECQGSGIGTMLIKHIIKYCKGKFYKIDLVSDDKNLKFYSKFKFIKYSNFLRINL